MSDRLKEALIKLIPLEFSDPKELAAFIEENNIHFTKRDLATWGWFLTSRLGPQAGMYYIPEWLGGVFETLAHDVNPKTICDPWAGIGFLAGVSHEAAREARVYAFTQDQSESVLGRTLNQPTTTQPLGARLKSARDIMPRTRASMATSTACRC
jgi:hypothetical protein